MTSITAPAFGFSFAASARSPRLSFAARLASLQARYEAPRLSAAFGAATRGILALVPFVGLTWVFVTV